MKRIFLLGGYDLEMIEIKKVLDQNGEEYIDKHFSWGAKLSDYQDNLDNLQNYTIYGIELENDIKLSNNYVEIDHHGVNDQKPSSLEQVADILGIKLTRFQQLIAQNDCKYINGMKSLCATKDEIDKIRKLDRQAQGITEFDEKLGIESVENCNSNIIYSLTPKFSVVSDITYYKWDYYIIYNDRKINFYGYKKDVLLKFLRTHNIKKDDYYFGGGKFGFVGIKENILDRKQIEKLIKEFTKLKNDKKETISHHIFMLPFKYYDKRKVLKDWDNPIEQKVSYNEQAYFHKFFIDSMFNNCEIYETNKYKTLKIKKSKLFELEVEKLTLRIFDDFKVGILSFHIENKNYYEIEDILKINDYGRRIYPEYLDVNKNCNLVADYIELDELQEDYNVVNSDNSPRISNIITKLIGNITPAVDDRMFTISYFSNPKLASELKENYECNDKWYEYVFVDGDGKTVQNISMQKDHIKKATYCRWQNYGTMYGISKYSFVCLSDNSFPLKHIKTIYFNIFTLLLMVRATLLKFAEEVSIVSNNLEKNTTANNVTKLYEKYIKFINKYYFREITAKDQGLELYEKALDILNIQRDIKDLDVEIEEFFKYVEMKQRKESEKESEKTNKKLEKIQIWGGYLLFVSVLTGFFGMNVGDSDNFSTWYVLPTIIVSLFVAYKIFNKEN